MQHFSPARLRSLREHAGVSRESLAVTLARGYHTIRAYEAGRIDPPASILAQVAEALGVKVQDLFEDAL